MNTLSVSLLELVDRAEGIRRRVVGAALDVHKALGPGFRESAYEQCLAYELRRRGHLVLEQQWVDVKYDDLLLERVGRMDLLVDDLVIVEVKSAAENHPSFGAQVVSYLKASGKPVGIYLNFGAQLLLKGGYDKFVHPDILAAIRASRRSSTSDPSDAPGSSVH